MPMNEFVKVKLTRYDNYDVRSCEDGGVLLIAEGYIEEFGHAEREFLLKEKEGMYEVGVYKKGDVAGRILREKLVSLLDEEASELIRKACFP